MRTMLAAIVLATLAGGSNALAMTIAGELGAAADAPRIAIQYWRGDYCERLRRACTYKEQRGGVGEGNCRRYRAECGERLSYCERLAAPASIKRSAVRLAKAIADGIGRNAAV